MSTNAENSIDLNVFEARRKLAHLVPRFAGTVEREDGWFVGARHQLVWAYGPTSRGEPGIMLSRPLLAGDLARLFAGYSKFPSSKVVCEVTGLFTRTSKMNCYSWNLPAGPIPTGGTCPGARMAFSDKVKGVKVKGLVRDPALAIDASREFSSEDFYDTVPSRSDEAVRRFLCNGCYALKKNYGYTSVVYNQLVKMAWLMEHALPENTFADVVLECIGELRDRSLQKPLPKDVHKRAEWTHPDFFRIHDSGDFFSPEYFYAWLEVCRRMPHVHFWAPTRIWCDMKTTEQNPVPMGRVLMQAIRNKDIPPNLAIRPSGLFFDGPQPNIPGLSGGASSSNFTYRETRNGIEVIINSAGKGAWGCPAYFPSEMGGGAPVLKPNPVPAKQVLRKMSMMTERSGVLYDAVVSNDGEYVIDPHNGKPISMNAAKAYLFDANWHIVGPRPKGHPAQSIPSSNIKAAQAYQPAGCCSIAIDPLGAEECRICWGVTAQRRDKDIKHLPVVYAEH